MVLPQPPHYFTKLTGLALSRTGLRQQGLRDDPTLFHAGAPGRKERDKKITREMKRGKQLVRATKQIKQRNKDI